MFGKRLPNNVATPPAPPAASAKPPQSGIADDSKRLAGASEQAAKPATRPTAAPHAKRLSTEKVEQFNQLKIL